MGAPAAKDASDQAPRRPALQVFSVFLSLGFTSFGGPVAHLGYFREAFVVRRRWLSEESYAALVALCQILPGPASSQVGFAIGLHEAGFRGALAAFIGFTLPSSLLMFAAVFGLGAIPDTIRTPVFHGLVLVAVPIVAHAVIGMATKLCNRPLTAAIGIVTLATLTLVSAPWLQPVMIIAGGLLGVVLLRRRPDASSAFTAPAPRPVAVACLATFLVLLVALPLLALATGSPAVRLTDGVYRSGALVFGGGHVILPLLEAETVAKGLVDADTFLAGYSVAQAAPGPLSSFAAYLGASAATEIPPLVAGLLALGAIFAPGFLLLVGVVPFWTSLSTAPWINGMAAGAGAAVVGVLAAALWRPVITTAILSPADALIAAAGLAALFARLPVGLVVLGVALAGAYWSAG